MSYLSYKTYLVLKLFKSFHFITARKRYCVLLCMIAVKLDASFPAKVKKRDFVGYDNYHLTLCITSIFNVRQVSNKS
jgi:hypothetical protein